MKRLDRWFYAPFPATRLASLRILVGAFSLGYLVLFSFEILAPLSFEAHRFKPIGIVSILSEPLPRFALILLYGLSLLLATAFVSGLRFAWTAPAFAISLLFLATYRNSWGMVFHTENMLVLHVIVLSLAPSADAWSLDHRSRLSKAPEDGRHGWAVRAMCVVTVASYVVAGVTKLRLTGWSWAFGEVLRTHIALDALQKIELGSFHSYLGAWMVQFAPLFAPLAVLTLAVELGAPLALIGGRMARLWVGAVWVFHVGVGAIMAIGFAYPLTGIAFAAFFAPERAFERLDRRA